MPALYFFSYRATCLDERDPNQRCHGLDLGWFSGEVGVPDQAG